LLGTVQEFSESISIQVSSTKLLNFLINDILDFSQIKSEKFRKESSQFNIKEAIEEILMVQKYKADQNCIEVGMELVGFESSLIVCSD
jgi:signal transduction histidine kinase